MVKPVQRCPVYAVRPKISFVQTGELDASAYQIDVPKALQGLDLPEPAFVDQKTLRSLLTKRVTSFSSPNGLVKAHFSVSFPDPGKQWRKFTVGGKNRWVFQGGDIEVEVRIGIYVWDINRPKGRDKIARELFKTVMDHELLHVEDDVDIVRSWLPPKVYGHKWVRRHLGHAMSLSETSYRREVERGGFEGRLHDDLWAPERNERAAVRDSPDAYAPVNEKIQTLRSQQ